jgi:glycosyltransferase involved in cell wall biosynthesis
MKMAAAQPFLITPARISEKAFYAKYSETLNFRLTTCKKNNSRNSGIRGFLPVLVSDIAANREVGLDARRYFRCGDVGDLAEKLAVLIDQGVSEEEKAWFRKEIAEKYDWGRIAGETVGV